jgi:hypothetical protein
MARVLPITPVAVPSLAELAADPERVSTLPANVLQALLVECVATAAKCAAVQGALIASLLVRNGAASGDAGEVDRLLTPDEAAEMLKTSTAWLRKNGHRLPFRRKLSRKAVRYSERGLRKWLAARG